MTAFQQVQTLLPNLTFAEKTKLLNRLIQDMANPFPGIEISPQVAGGEPCLIRTRIPVWVIVQAKKLGSSEADILRAYPTLRREDLKNAWTYYLAHQEDIEQQIHENETV